MSSLRRRAALSTVLAVVWTFGASAGASGTFTSSAGPSGATYSSGTLGPPTAVAAANGACTVLTSTSVNLSWTATASAFADGYQVLRSTTSGSGYASVGSVSGRTTSSFTDTTPAFLTTYYYVVRSTRNTWRSGNSNEATVTTPTPLCV